jgi:hypothetical protein
VLGFPDQHAGDSDWWLAAEGAVMARSLVQLPFDVSEPFEVYVNGVRQLPGIDFAIEGCCLVFDAVLRQDRISAWRWLVGPSGVGTYRQNDSIDVRYEVDGPRVAQGLDSVVIEDGDQ